MPIEAPNLDDLRYDRVVEELIRRIPVYAPEWTDYNASDPGIALIQLFAYLTEQVGYRLNRIPEKNHVELLKLLGVRLKPGNAAQTRLALFLSNPATLEGFTLPASVIARAKKGDPPPEFETDREIDIVPAEPVVLIGTKNPLLWDVLDLSDGTRDEEPTDDDLQVPAEDTEWLGVVWDGDDPKAKDMPLEPVALWKRPKHRYVWIGLNFNDALDAGFLGVRVTLNVQFDDDEQPLLTAIEKCATPLSVEQAPPRIDWLHYYDAETNNMEIISGRIDDTTERLTRSGHIRCTIPFSMGAIPESKFVDLVMEVPLDAQAGCAALGNAIKDHLPTDGDGTIDLAEFQEALTKAVDDATGAEQEARPPVSHPLDPALRNPAKAKGWLRIQLPEELLKAEDVPKLRIITFNAVSATHATTVSSELLGRADGRPGQSLQLGNGNVLEGTLEVAVQEQPEALLVPWVPVDSLDGAGPFDRVFEFDPEAGTLLFGDGQRGRILPLVPGAGNIVALRYRHGGGKAGETDTGTITVLESPRAGLTDATNFVPARGGRDAEILDDAKARARKELSTRHRAVTASDFEFIALQTPGVRVGRVAVIPLRTPLLNGTATPPIAVCGAELPTGPLGLDTFTAHGAVTVVVVPDPAGTLRDPEPLPTPSFLRAVCEHLNRHRLVTTEVHVVPPQYLRLCNLIVHVKGKPGYTRTQLQGLVVADLEVYLHVLNGGDQGTGFPFGGQLHAADLVARILRTEGIDRVQYFEAKFTRTRSLAEPRQGRLLLCPSTAAADEGTNLINLDVEETVSVDASTLTLQTVS